MDLQFAFAEGIRDYMIKNIDYLKTQMVTQKVLMFQTKKYYDPRKWMRERNNFQYETRASIC
jgi:fructose-bisphosphate aldolase class II